LGEAAELRPFRDGFIDIAELADDLFAESASKEKGESDLTEFSGASEKEPAATDAHGNGSPSAHTQSEDGLNPTVEEMDGRVRAGTTEASAPQGLREGMIELVHDDSSPVGAPAAGQDAEVQTPEMADASFLRIDGPVARYQAFEMAPPAEAAHAETPPHGKTPQHEKPAPKMVSYEASDRSPRGIAPAALAPALVALFFRRRSRCRAGSNE
jgi:hypothetical protein